MFEDDEDDSFGPSEDMDRKYREKIKREFLDYIKLDTRF